MPTITMPKLSDTMTEGTIARWRKKKGDPIEMGDILADIETDKATMEMEAFDDGVLTEIYVPDGPGDQRTPLSNMRRTIAEPPLASKLQNPHFYATIEVDAGPLMRLRKEFNANNEAAGLPKLPVSDFLLLAISRAATSHPAIN